MIDQRLFDHAFVKKLIEYKAKLFLYQLAYQSIHLLDILIERF